MPSSGFALKVKLLFSEDPGSNKIKKNLHPYLQYKAKFEIEHCKIHLSLNPTHFKR